MRSAVRKIGNSAGVILPKPFLAGIGADVGGAVEMTLEQDRIVIAAAPRKPREGWEEDAKRLAAEGLSEEDREWLDAPLSAETDEDWEW